MNKVTGAAAAAVMTVFVATPVLISMYGLPYAFDRWGSFAAFFVAMIMIGIPSVCAMMYEEYFRRKDNQ